MTNDVTEPPPMRMGDCPYCERSVLVYEDPARCPLCACPLEEHAMRPFEFPVAPPAFETDPE
jgi:predicted amidophosphoribosyltransferase